MSDWEARPASGIPARGYVRPPFAEGNEASLTHGADSPRRWRPVAERLLAELVEVAPWTARPAYRRAVEAWARVEAQAHLIAEWVDRVGVIDPVKDEPRPQLDRLDRLEARAAKLRAALGLDPSSLARLLDAFARHRGKSLIGDAADLESLVLEGRRALDGPEASDG